MATNSGTIVSSRSTVTMPRTLSAWYGQVLLSIVSATWGYRTSALSFGASGSVVITRPPGLVTRAKSRIADSGSSKSCSAVLHTTRS